MTSPNNSLRPRSNQVGILRCLQTQSTCFCSGILCHTSAYTAQDPMLSTLSWSWPINCSLYIESFYKLIGVKSNLFLHDVQQQLADLSMAIQRKTTSTSPETIPFSIHLNGADSQNYIGKQNNWNSQNNSKEMLDTSHYLTSILTVKLQ